MLSIIAFVSGERSCVWAEEEEVAAEIVVWIDEAAVFAVFDSVVDCLVIVSEVLIGFVMGVVAVMEVVGFVVTVVVMRGETFAVVEVLLSSVAAVAAVAAIDVVDCVLIGENVFAKLLFVDRVFEDKVLSADKLFIAA